VSLPPLAFAAPMCSAQDDAALPAPGFPIRRSAGQRLFSASPRLIAAVHVLHRLLVPRHPPHALSILTVIRPDGLRRPCVHVSRPCGRPAWIDNSMLWPSVQFSRSDEKRLNAAHGQRRSLKTKQHAGLSAPSRLVDVSGRHWRAELERRTLATRTRRSAIARLRAP